MKFHGDVILIDPCYAVRNQADCEICRYGEEMSALGFSQFVYVDTVWEYMGRVYDSRTGRVLGTFGTETHALCALYYHELLNYNPDYFKEYGNAVHPEKSVSTCTILKDFSGEIEANPEKGCLIGTGNICFTAKLNQEEEDFSKAIERTGGQKTSFSLYYKAKRKTPLTEPEISDYEKIIAHHQKYYPLAKRNCENFCVYQTAEQDIVFSGAVKFPDSEYMAVDYWLRCLTKITELLSGCEWHVSFEDISLIFDKHDGWRFPTDEEYESPIKKERLSCS